MQKLVVIGNFLKVVNVWLPLRKYVLARSLPQTAPGSACPDPPTRVLKQHTPELALNRIVSGRNNNLSDLVPDFYFFPDWGPEMGSRRPGRCLKGLLVAVGFTLTDYGPVGSHGYPIRGRKYGLGQQACAVLRQQTCAVLRQQICAVLRQQICVWLCHVCVCVVCFVKCLF